MQTKPVTAPSCRPLLKMVPYLVDLDSRVQDEDVARVEVAALNLNLTTGDRLGALALQKARLVGHGLYVIEARGNAAVQRL